VIGDAVPPQTPRRVAFIDDDRNICEVVEIVFDVAGGYDLRTFTSGAAAVAVLPAWRPDLIVLDATMPGMDGAETLAALRCTGGLASVPAVFLTGRTRDSDIAAFMALGAAAVLAKPFDPAELVRRIGAILDGAI
jgi:DNA-binding response OmpR family regulator